MAESQQTLTLTELAWTSDVGFSEVVVDTTRLVVVSTPASRSIAANPALVGDGYVKSVAAATTAALRLMRSASNSLLDDSRPHPLVILRGGLTFGAAESLESIGYGPGPQSFITSESRRNEGAEPRQLYAKFESIGDARTLLICDIVASGDTIIKAATLALSAGESIDHLIVVGFLTEEGVSKIHHALGGRVRLTMVGLEGIFRLPEAEDVARSFTSPCDFRRSDFVCRAEYLEVLSSDLGLAEEQCLVYDGGERAFAPTAHSEGRARYLRHLATLSESAYWDELEFRTGVLFQDRSRVLPSNDAATSTSLDDVRTTLDRLRDAGRRARNSVT